MVFIPWDIFPEIFHVKFLCCHYLNSCGLMVFIKIMDWQFSTEHNFMINHQCCNLNMNRVPITIENCSNTDIFTKNVG